MEHIENLRLPKVPIAEAGAKRGGTKARAQIKLPPQMQLLTKIEVSGFMGQRLSRAGFRELIEGLE